MVIQVQPMPLWVWLAGWALTIYALWSLRKEFSDFADAHPTAVRIGCALLFCVAGATSLHAAVIYLPCEWSVLLELCDGNEWCAWAMWFGNACAFRPS